MEGDGESRTRAAKLDALSHTQQSGRAFNFTTADPHPFSFIGPCPKRKIWRRKMCLPATRLALFVPWKGHSKGEIPRTGCLQMQFSRIVKAPSKAKRPILCLSDLGECIALSEFSLNNRGGAIRLRGWPTMRQRSGSWESAAPWGQPHRCDPSTKHRQRPFFCEIVPLACRRRSHVTLS